MAIVRRYKPLTPMQELFVKEYLVDLNATQAFIRAGGHPEEASYFVPKWTRKGSAVSVMIARAMAERAKRVGISHDRTLEKLGQMLFGDPRVLFREDGSLKGPHEYTLDDAMMIEGIKTRRIVELDESGEMRQAEIQEVKLVSKATVAGMVMRHLGMMNDKLDINVNMSLQERMNNAAKRVLADVPVATENSRDDDIETEYEEVEVDDDGNPVAVPFADPREMLK